MFYWIYDMPTFAFGAMVLAIFVTGGASADDRDAARLVQYARSTPSGAPTTWWGRRSPALQVLYGLLLGLLAVGTLRELRPCRGGREPRSRQPHRAYHMVSSYPAPIRQELRGDIAAYTLDTIDTVWPLQRQGLVPPENQQRLTVLYAALMPSGLTDPGETVTHAETLKTLNEYAELRRARLTNVSHGLPPILWYVVIIGAVIAIVFVSLFDMELGVHLILGGLFSAFLGMTIFLIATLDHPFRGGVSVSSHALARAYESVMKPDPPEQGSRRRPGSATSAPHG